MSRPAFFIRAAWCAASAAVTLSAERPPAGLRLHGVVDRHHRLAQPALDHGVALLERAQAGTRHLAGRRIGAGLDQLVDIATLGGRRADRPFFQSRPRWILRSAGYEKFIPQVVPKQEGKACGVWQCHDLPHPLRRRGHHAAGVADRRSPSARSTCNNVVSSGLPSALSAR